MFNLRKGLSRVRGNEREGIFQAKTLPLPFWVDSKRTSNAFAHGLQDSGADISVPPELLQRDTPVSLILVCQSHKNKKQKFWCLEEQLNIL